MRIGDLVEHRDARGAFGDQVFEGEGLERLGLDGDALVHGAGGQALVKFLAGDDLRGERQLRQALRRVLRGDELQELPVGVGEGGQHGMRAPQPDGPAFLFALGTGEIGGAGPCARRAWRPVAGPFCMVARHEVHPYKAASGVDRGLEKPF